MVSESTSKEIFINPASKDKCYKTLKESKVEIGTAKTIGEKDWKTTIAANRNAKETINDVNSVRIIVGNYIDIDAENLATISRIINQEDIETSQLMGQ